MRSLYPLGYNLEFWGYYVVALLQSFSVPFLECQYPEHLPQTTMLQTAKQPLPAPPPFSRSCGSPAPESLWLLPGRVYLCIPGLQF